MGIDNVTTASNIILWPCNFEYVCKIVKMDKGIDIIKLVRRFQTFIGGILT